MLTCFIDIKLFTKKKYEASIYNFLFSVQKVQFLEPIIYIASI